MTAPTLAGRVMAIEAALTEVAHAFGGALALAYYAEPRATINIDLNVFVPVEQFSDVAVPLVQIGASADDPTIEALIRRDGQARVKWDRTPIDLYFSYDAFHEAAGAACHVVPFGDGTIPILAADHLIVGKAVYNRPKDWVDIESMLAAGADIDSAEVLRWVARITGDEDRASTGSSRCSHALTTQVDTEPGPGGPVQAGSGRFSLHIAQMIHPKFPRAGRNQVRQQNGPGIEPLAHSPFAAQECRALAQRGGTNAGSARRRYGSW